MTATESEKARQCYTTPQGARGRRCSQNARGRRGEDTNEQTASPPTQAARRVLPDRARGSDGRLVLEELT